MKGLRIVCLFLLLAVPCVSQTRTVPRKPIPVTGTRASLIPPVGFTPSDRFPGFSQQSTNASIMVSEISGSFTETSSGLTDPAGLSKRGMVLLGNQKVSVVGYTGILVQVRQSMSGTEYLKWLFAIGDEQDTLFVVAVFPKALERKLSEKLKASILSVRWDKKKTIEPTEGLNFSIAETGDLRIAGRMANTLVFSKNGVSPSKDIDDPIFVVGQSLAKADIADHEGFAKARVLKTAEVTDVEIESSKRITIDALNGYEIVATAKDKASNKPMAIYQIILFEEDGYFIMGGLVSERNRQPSLKVFEEMARTFKRK